MYKLNEVFPHTLNTQVKIFFFAFIEFTKTDTDCFFLSYLSFIRCNTPFFVNTFVPCWTLKNDSETHCVEDKFVFLFIFTVCLIKDLFLLDEKFFPATLEETFWFYNKRQILFLLAEHVILFLTFSQADELSSSRPDIKI